MPWKYKHHILAPVHSLLIPANAIIITGGSYLASDAGTDPTDFNEKAKVLRSIGSGIFLGVTLFYNGCVVKTYLDSRRQRTDTHMTLPILALVGLLLIVRGLFGLLQSAVWSVSSRDFPYSVNTLPLTSDEFSFSSPTSTHPTTLHMALQLASLL